MAGSLNPGLPSPPVTRAEKSALRHRPEGRPARRNERFRPGGFLDPLAGDRRDRGRLRTARQAMQPLLLLRRKQGGAAGKRVALSTHLSEGRPSEGTGHGSDRATGGAGFGLLWHPAKRRSAFSEVGGCSRTARRSQATVRTGPDLWGAISGWRWVTPQGICRKAGCWQASEPLNAVHLAGHCFAAALFGARVNGVAFLSTGHCGFGRRRRMEGEVGGKA